VGGHDLLACRADDDDLHHLACRVDRNHDHATSTTRRQPLRVDLATSITTTSTTIPPRRPCQVDHHHVNPPMLTTTSTTHTTSISTTTATRP
jgi:hypothetical protein